MLSLIGAVECRALGATLLRCQTWSHKWSPRLFADFGRTSKLSLDQVNLRPYQDVPSPSCCMLDHVGPLDQANYPIPSSKSLHISTVQSDRYRIGPFDSRIFELGFVWLSKTSRVKTLKSMPPAKAISQLRWMLSNPKWSASIMRLVCIVLSTFNL